MKKLVLATLVCSLSSTYAVASENTTHYNKYQGFYVGVGIGATDFHDSRPIDVYNNDYFGYSTESNDASYKAIAGYQFNRIVSLEAQYTKYGDIKHNIDVLGKVKLNFAKTEHESFTIAANLGYTFDSGIRPFATVGYGQISLKDLMIKDDGDLIRLGAGLEYQIKQIPGLGIRAAYEADFYTLEEGNKDFEQSIGSWYVGTTYKF